MPRQYIPIGTQRLCEYCGKAFIVKHPKNANRFCSQACAFSYRYPSTTHLDSQGYVRVVEDGERRREHRVVMETILGRKLGADECIHHKDGNRQNNDPSNLMVVSPSEHQHIHVPPLMRWAKNYDCCVRCGTTEKKHNARGLCMSCYDKERG